jgi:peptidoglycan/xylan/chitin deacetylase (PgdA/CDA1 family)
VLGSQVVANPDILRRIYEDGKHLLLYAPYHKYNTNRFTVMLGHEICSHTWSHSALTALTNEQIIAEIRWTEKAIRDVIGITPRYLRPPYGDIDDRVRAVVEAAGYEIVHWNLDSFDWQIADVPPTPPHVNIIAQNLYEKLFSNTSYTNELSEVKHRTEKGFIVLAHDARSDVVNGWIAAL